MERNQGGAIMKKYLLAMELNINAYAIVEGDDEEEAKKKGANLKFDCNLSPVDNYGKIVSVVPFYYGDVDAEVVDVELYERIVYRLYNHYCRKKEFRDSCVKWIRNTDELGQGQKVL